jgi:hypothetical protein
MIKLVFSWLKNNWIWINYMPNADSVLLSNNWMYIDISHKRIYNSNSFEQLLNISLKNYEVEHINAYIWYSMFIKRLIHNIFLLVTKIYYKWMWMIAFPKIYTWEFISVIIKNKWKN